MVYIAAQVTAELAALALATCFDPGFVGRKRTELLEQFQKHLAERVLGVEQLSSEVIITNVIRLSMRLQLTAIKQWITDKHISDAKGQEMITLAESRLFAATPPSAKSNKSFPFPGVAPSPAVFVPTRSKPIAVAARTTDSHGNFPWLEHEVRELQMRSALILLTDTDLPMRQ